MKDLTPRQAQILELVANEGLSNHEIGKRLGLSPHTVRTHVHTVCRRLGVQSKLEASCVLWSKGYLIFTPDGREIRVPR